MVFSRSKASNTGHDWLQEAERCGDEAEDGKVMHSVLLLLMVDFEGHSEDETSLNASVILKGCISTNTSSSGLSAAVIYSFCAWRRRYQHPLRAIL